MVRNGDRTGRQEGTHMTTKSFGKLIVSQLPSGVEGSQPASTHTTGMGVGVTVTVRFLPT